MASIAATLWGAAAWATDMLPPRARYGYVHRATAAVLHRPLLRLVGDWHTDAAGAGTMDGAGPVAQERPGDADAVDRERSGDADAVDRTRSGEADAVDRERSGGAGDAVSARPGDADAATAGRPARVDAVAAARAPGPAPGTEPVRCVLLTDALDVGGIGTVVELLADGLAARGVQPVVLSPADGERSRRLRDRGIRALVADDERTATALLRELGPDVLQLHGAPEYLERAAIASGIPMVPVLHNTEIHFSAARWVRFAALLERSATAIAVSDTVRAFHVRHCPPALADRVMTVANGAAPPAEHRARRDAARRVLGAMLGADLENDVLFVALGRYDAQKNVAGTVASFLRALDAAPTDAGAAPRLVFAGAASDWVEYRRARALRDASPHRDRVHLLGPSDADLLLAAADAFVLNSFFEGWPVAASEAAARGLPLLLAEFGGAAELVADDPVRSILIRNAIGAPEAVSDAAVRTARRHSRHQDNAEALAAAVRRMVANRPAETPADDTAVRAAAARLSEMLGQHATILTSAARARVH
ncbi:glycosyltransferase family 4 protein [Microbacterium paludicola]|uniref:glycosyltransferase family 4 protein n=1 Tax=Microbacterium paludicola TaxID=300019 RepID=UPI001643404B|nr:glycosyltransferase family 4 protein [Microbacterium paludicola]